MASEKVDPKEDSDDSGVGTDLPSDAPSAPMPPDGGWGWVITFASFMVSVLVDGVCFTFGIFLTEFLEYFDGSKGKTALLGSVLNGSYMVLGPIAGALVNRFGCRVVAMMGSLIASIGFFLCIFSSNLNMMIFLYGAVGGCGFGLMYLPAILMVGYYFDKRRAFATGIAVCGSGIGNFIFAPLCEFLLKYYSWQGAMWIISGMVLNGIVFATLYRPLSGSSVRRKNNSESNSQLNETNDIEKSTTVHKNGFNKDFRMSGTFEMDMVPPIYKCKSMELYDGQNSNDILNGGSTWVGRLAFSQDISKLQKLRRRKNTNCRSEYYGPLDRKDIFYTGSLHNIIEHQESKSEKEFIRKMTITHDSSRNLKIKQEDVDNSKSSIWNKAKTIFFEMFDFSLLLSPTFVIYGLSCFLCMFGFFIPFNFLPDLAKDLHISSNDAAFLISMIGISNTISRILVGFVSDQPWADSLLINNVSLIIGGMATFFVPFYMEYGILAAYGIVFGAAIAAFVSLRSIIMVELMGIEKLTSAFGLVVLCQGLSSFIGSPIAGAISDQTGDYNISFYLSGATMALAGIICLPLRKVAHWENKRHAVANKDSERKPML